MTREKRIVKARYRTKPLGKITVVENRASIDPETKSLQQETVRVEKEMFMVYFPKGHSIRIEKSELVRMGYHKRPKLVDMETGETVDLGGDPYDFMNMEADEQETDFEVVLKDEDDLVIEDDEPKSRRKGA